MDDDYLFSEKQSIRESARTLKKYGSTCCNHVRNNETLIRHDVEKTDTLQGIALKYGCTTEQIRRANRLFASDSLFLRQFLLVPVDKSSPYYPKPALVEEEILENISAIHSTENHVRSPVTLPPRPYSIAGSEQLAQASGADATKYNQPSNNSSSGNQSKSLDSVATPLSPDEENRKCIDDFLNKIDTTISESRKYVEQSKEKIMSQSDDDLFVTTDTVPRRRSNQLNNSYRNNNQQSSIGGQGSQHMRQNSAGSASDTAHLLNTTQMRRVQNSLKQLEKQQDEFFEL